MKKFLIIPLLFCLPCYGAIITIEADDYPIETPISDSLDYITLRAGTGSGFGAEVVAVPSTHTMKLLGEKVLGYSWDIEWWASSRRFRITFGDYESQYPPQDLVYSFAKSLSVKILGKEGTLKGGVVLEGYNADHERVNYIDVKAQAGVTTLWSPGRGPYEIAYYYLYSERPVAFDHIVIDYQPIPEPSTILLLLGLMLIKKGRTQRERPS